jgi:hypothetical protein
MIGEVTKLLEAYGTGTPAWSYGAHIDVSAEIRLSAATQIEATLNELQARSLIFSWSWNLPRK